MDATPASDALGRSGSPSACKPTISPGNSSRDPIDRLAEEFVARYRKGERPSVSEFVRNYPQVAEQLQEVIQALVLLEDLAPGKESDPAAGEEVAVGPTLERLGDFRIIREVGRGGMGIVYEAMQESLGRRVAVKILPFNSLLASNQLERFRREARAAAGLQHDHIVPVFAVDEVAGVHFYAMQFIQGQGLEQVLAEIGRIRQAQTPPSVGAYSSTEPGPDEVQGGMRRSIASSLFTEQFAYVKSAPAPAAASTPSPSGSENGESSPSSMVKSELSHHADSSSIYCRSVALIGFHVAEALAYAHSQGVLHRDIKPSNLLLDLAGKVWVTDFGLAKTDESGPLTHTGDLVGTLRYMAPERFSGWSDPRSDIYSLGATLYEMITLRPAYNESDHHRLLKRLAEEAPPLPRKLDPRIPRDLETIVLKAMAREPLTRYQNSGQLADDLKRFLDGRPIQARRTSSIEQLRLWCRRNPALASSCGLVVLTLVLGLAAAGWLWHRAEVQRLAAEAHFQQAREAVEECFSTVTEDPELQEPGLEAARRVLLQTALKYYRRFLEYQGGSRPVQADLAQAYFRVGTIVARIGSPAEAVEPFRQAEESYQRLALEGPDQSRFQRHLVNCSLELGVLCQTLGRTKEAREEYQRGVTRCRQLVEENPSDPGARHELANLLQKLGSLHRETQHPADAEAHLMDAALIHEKLVEAFPLEPRYQRALAGDLTALAMAYYQTNNPGKAESHWLKSLGLLEGLAKQQPSASDLQRELANTYSGLGAFYFNTSLELKRIEDYYLKALSIREQLVRDHPRVNDYQGDLGRSLNNLALFYTLNDRPREASESYLRALSLREALARRFPEVFAYRLAVAKTYHDLGLLHNRNKQPDQAGTAFRKALEIQEKLCREFPGNSNMAIERAISLLSLAGLAEDRADWRETLGLLQKASEILCEVLQAEPNQHDALSFDIQARAGQAWALACMGRLTDSIRLWKELPVEKLSSAQQKRRAQSLALALRW
jgi:serine/threonine protein kinase